LIREPLAKKVAAEQLAAVGITSPPADLEAIALRNGLRIVRGATLGSDVRARLRPLMGLIEVADLGPVVERFAIAHELGHALLDHGGDRTCYETPVYDSVPLGEADMGISFEQEASAFASHLLVPRSWLRTAVDRGLTIPELRAIFEVTQPVLWIAITDAKLINRLASP
jgi:Zn-dependent peptidase ImmA (M78 family)